MPQRRLCSAVLFAVLIGTLGATSAGDKVPLYSPGAVVRARCDGGDELRRLSIYGSPNAVWATNDKNEPMPHAAHMVRAGSLLRVLATSRWQTYTPVSHTPFLNLQVLKVEPVGGADWRGYVDSLSVDPLHGPKDWTNICE
jgi:hypothetical protein